MRKHPDLHHLLPRYVSLSQSESRSSAADRQPSTSAAPTPAEHHIFIFAGNWTRIESSGGGCPVAWGGLGAAPEVGAIRGWVLPIRGDEVSWATTFRYTTYETGGDQANPAPVWEGAASPDGSPSSKIKATYRVRPFTAPQRPVSESSVPCICGASCRRICSSQ